MDIDWASDEIIDYCKELLLKHRVKATWFITHDSPAIKEIFKHRQSFEVGIHPNFLPGSTQGSNTQEVMEHLLRICPDAKIMRTHSLYQSSLLFLTIIEKYPQIDKDVSLFLPYAKYTESYRLFLNQKYITRIPFIWEDDFEMTSKEPKFALDHRFDFRQGAKIFNFHPIHIVLNSCGYENYLKLKNSHDPKKLSLKQALRFRNKALPGTEDFLRELIARKEKKSFIQELEGVS